MQAKRNFLRVAEKTILCANIGFDIEISQKYRYRIGIGYEIARKWISKSISFRNYKLTDIGFDFDFEILNARIWGHFRDNF